jgi:hypothetical protein
MPKVWSLMSGMVALIQTPSPTTYNHSIVWCHQTSNPLGDHTRYDSTEGMPSKIKAELLKRN